MVTIQMSCVAVEGEEHVHTNSSDLGIQDIDRCFDHLDSYSHLAMTFRQLHQTLQQDINSSDANITATVSLNTTKVIPFTTTVNLA